MRLHYKAVTITAFLTFQLLSCNFLVYAEKPLLPYSPEVVLQGEWLEAFAVAERSFKMRKDASKEQLKLSNYQIIFSELNDSYKVDFSPKSYKEDNVTQLSCDLRSAKKFVVTLKRPSLDIANIAVCDNDSEWTKSEAP